MRDLSKEKPFVDGDVCAPRRMSPKILVSRVCVRVAGGCANSQTHLAVMPEGGSPPVRHELSISGRQMLVIITLRSPGRTVKAYSESMEATILSVVTHAQDDGQQGDDDRTSVRACTRRNGRHR